MQGPQPHDEPAAAQSPPDPVRQPTRAARDVTPARTGNYEIDEELLASLELDWDYDDTTAETYAPEASAARPRRSTVREVLETVVLALLIFVSVQGVVQNFRVEGSSMDPNLHDGERLLVNRAIFFQLDLDAVSKFIPFIDSGDRPLRFLFRGPERGDIIVFRYPRNPSRDFIKRVIGVPGDTVEVRRGRVFINGEAISEPYIRFKATYNAAKVEVPPGQYYVLGDNRGNSSDSHVWGLVPEENIIGLAWLAYWPPESAGLAPNLSIDVPAPGGE